MDRTIVSANNITKSFVSVRALDNVSVSINRGEIRCLAGENGSGKSTFVKVVAGVLAPDSGEIVVNNNSYPKLTPIGAINEGIQVIYQDLSLFPHMTVAENIAMNKMVAVHKRLVNWDEVYRVAEEQLELIGHLLDLKAQVGTLSVGNRQIVAICRALSLNAKVLFMDEPTTALTQKEIDRLLSIVMDLKAKGLSIIFISHKLNEIFEVADYITIFRDGKKVGDFENKALDKKSLTYHMTGREVEYPRYRRVSNDDLPLLEVRNLTRNGNYKNISFKLQKGDILGITGIRGSGRSELALSLFGLNPPNSGEILVKGRPFNIKIPDDAVNQGIVLMPEDRQTEGLFLKKSLKENISSTILDRIKTKAGFIDRKKQEEIAAGSVKKLKIRTQSVDTLVRNLSGGNQQKTVLAKWVATGPELFILDSPTVGVDIGSKAEIYELIHRFASEGMGIILISDELEEILANCNKVLVMYAGEILEILTEKDLDKPDVGEHILAVMSRSRIVDSAEKFKNGEAIPR